MKVSNEELMFLMFALLFIVGFLQIFVFGGWRLGLAFLVMLGAFAGFLSLVFR